jgi:rhodanese-related sulfurtransferase
VVVDLRHDFDVQAEPRMIPGAVRLTPAELEQGKVAIPRDREAVLYCS